MLSFMEILLAILPAVFGKPQESNKKVAQLTQCKTRKTRLVIRVKISWLEEES